MMNEQTPPTVTLAEQTAARDRRTGRLLLGSSLTNVLFGAVIVVLLLVVGAQSGTIGILSGSLIQQRDQFTACKNKPAATRGCTTPIAAEPSVIVKQTKVLPGIPGANGLTPPCYYESRQCRGQDGKDAPTPAPAKDGITPPCMQTPRQCQGNDGKDAPTPAPAKDGKDGLTPPCMSTESQCQGKDGITPPCYFDAAQCQGGQGEMGVQGQKGVGISSSQCVNDDTPAGSHWLITYSDGAQETSPGPCRVNLP
jgi:hypothetical protein